MRAGAYLIPSREVAMDGKQMGVVLDVRHQRALKQVAEKVGITRIETIRLMIREVARKMQRQTAEGPTVNSNPTWRNSWTTALFLAVQTNAAVTVGIAAPRPDAPPG